MNKKVFTIKNIVYPELENKLLSFFRLIDRSSEFAKNLKNTLDSFDSLFSNKNAYQHILKKAHILSEYDEKIQVLHLQDPSTFQLSLFVSAENCPTIFHEILDFNYNSNNFGLALRKVNVEEEYCLLLDMTGEMTAMIYYKDKKIDVYNFYSNFNILTLDLPLIMYGLINGVNSFSTKLALEAIIKKNPVSTLANVFAYIRANSKEISELPKKLNLLAKRIDTFLQKIKSSTTENHFLSNNIRKEFGVGAGVHLPPYAISLENGEVSIKTKYAKENVTAYNFKNYEEAFPAVITIKGGKFTPYFLRNEFFHDEGKVKKLGENLYCLKKNKGLIPLDKKIEELCSLEQEKIDSFENWQDGGYKEYAHYILAAKLKNEMIPEKFIFPAPKKKETKAFKKAITRDLNRNINLVLATLEKHVDYCSNETLFLKQEKFLLKAQKLVLGCKKISEEIAGTLGKIYKNEIVLKNL